MTVELIHSILPEAAAWGAILTTIVFGPTLTRYALMRPAPAPTDAPAQEASATA